MVLSYQALTDLTIFDSALGIAALVLALVVIGHSSSQSGQTTCKSCGSNQQIQSYTAVAADETASDTVKKLCTNLNTGKNKFRYLFNYVAASAAINTYGTTAAAASDISFCQRNDQYADGNTKTCSGKNLECNSDGMGIWSSS